MQLTQLTDRVWYSPFEAERDRPALGYIRGDHWSIAVDAGHSAAHTAEFYQALEAEGLPLPALTVLTHWHWDHTLGMHSVHGLCLSNDLTASHLRELQTTIAREGREALLSLHESIRLEYANDAPVIVTLPELTFSGTMTLNPGGCEVRLSQMDGPHTDDATLIHLPGEGVLFIGDAISGVFPTWKKDPARAEILAAAVRAIDARHVIGSHWPPMTHAETLEAILDLHED